VKVIDEQTVKDWNVCARIIRSAEGGILIASRPGMSSLSCITFTSDAAGSKFDLLDGIRKFKNFPGDRGVACLSSEKGMITWHCRAAWSKNLLESARDQKGSYYGSKTTTLEAVGLLLPFVTIPRKPAGKDIVFKTDNIAEVYGWESKSVKFDRSATILIKAVTIMAFYLGSRVFVEHLPRMTSLEAKLADHLSRLFSMEKEDWRLLESAEESYLDGPLKRWIADPSEDEELPFSLLREQKEKMES